MEEARTKSSAKTKVEKKKGVGRKVIGSNKENKAVTQEDVETPVTPQKKDPISKERRTMTPSGESANLLKKVAISTPSFEEENIVHPTSLFETESRVKKVYKIVQKSTGALGGNGYNGAIYGELTLHSMQKVGSPICSA